MITIYEGFPGSGKTYDAVRKIIANLQKKRRVITNIDGLNHEHQQEAIKHLTDLTDSELSGLLVVLIEKEDIAEFWKLTKPGDLIVIDEIQDYFNSRDWNKKTNREFGSWASSHRHNAQDLIMITPNQQRVESAVRDMAEWYYRYKKLNMFGSALQKKYVRFAFYGQDTEPMGKRVCSYDQRIFNCYKSYFVEDAKEIAVQKQPNVLKHPIFYLIPVVLIAFFYFFSKSSLITGDIFGSKTISHTIEKRNSIGPASAAVAAPPDQLKQARLNKEIKVEKKLIGTINARLIYRLNSGGVEIQ